MNDRIVLYLHVKIKPLNFVPTNPIKMPKKKKQEKKPDVHDKLKGFDIKINEFGEIKTNLEIEQLNQFLDDNVEDKKLRDREDQTHRTEEE